MHCPGLKISLTEKKFTLCHKNNNYSKLTKKPCNKLIPNGQHANEGSNDLRALLDTTELASSATMGYCTSS